MAQELLRVVFVVSFACVANCYQWSSSQCQALVEQSSDLRGTGCVSKGSIPNVNLDCKPCVFNYQCESGWCVDSWKLCYDSGLSCYTQNTAGCEDCSSSDTVDLSQCKCANQNFPNNWVQCTDGSGGYDTYSLSATKGYTRQENSDGSLRETDAFAMNSVCFHNKFREEAAGLGGVKWNNGLAKFAKDWVEKLKRTNNCNMKHSSTRSDIGGFSYSGENLYWAYTSGDIAQNDLPSYGRKAAEGWYSEMKYYTYAGSKASFNACPMRNIDSKAQIGHLTQLLWDKTTDIGCDYALCSNGGSSIVVSCVYGPGGNYVNQAAFNDTAYCNLNKWPENVEKYDGLPRCDNTSPDCTQIPTGPVDNGGSDGKCAGIWGGTCTFPIDTPFGTFRSCQDGVDMLLSPWCPLENGAWDQCSSDLSDPDCAFNLPYN